MVKYELIVEEPCKAYLAVIDIDSNHVPLDVEKALDRSIPPEYRHCSFRGVSLERLATVLKLGIDVEPTDAVIWVNYLDKALESGGWPKLVMALDWNFLKRTFVEVDANASEAELNSVRREYPTILKSVDGSTLYCSRLKEDAPQLYTSYEWDSARWIPGDPWKALKAIFIICRQKDCAALSLRLTEILGGPVAQP